MKTATVTDLASDLQAVLGLVAAGEEVAITRDDRVVAMLVPPVEPAPGVTWPDFAARARRIVGHPRGTPPGQVIAESRGERK